jgi:hypothetical protein
MQLPKDLNEYLRAWAPSLGDRILQTYPPLQAFDDVASPLAGQLLRKPFPAQTVAIMGVVRRWREARGADSQTRSAPAPRACLSSGIPVPIRRKGRKDLVFYFRDLRDTL